MQDKPREMRTTGTPLFLYQMTVWTTLGLRLPLPLLCWLCLLGLVRHLAVVTVNQVALLCRLLLLLHLHITVAACQWI